MLPSDGRGVPSEIALNPEHEELLVEKLRNYEARIQGTDTNGPTPGEYTSLDVDMMRYRITLIKSLRENGSLHRVQMARQIQEAEGQFSDDQDDAFTMAWLLIHDYATTGGQNVTTAAQRQQS